MRGLTAPAPPIAAGRRTAGSQSARQARHADPPPAARASPRPTGPGGPSRRRGRRGRRCAAACGSPTDACSAARCPPPATARSSSACCTPRPRELVELTPGTRPPDGRLELDRRRRPEHYLPGGASGDRDWLAGLLGARRADRRRRLRHAQLGERPARRGVRRRRPADAAGAARRTRSPHTRWLWVDVDRPGRLRRAVGVAGRAAVPSARSSPAARAACTPTGGSPSRSGHARRGATADVVEPIERANVRIIHALGTGAGRQAQRRRPRCKERARVMRLAGTINHKPAAWARDARGRLRAAPLPDRRARRRPARPRARRRSPRDPARTGRPATRTSGSRRPSTSSAWPASASRAAGWCPARSPRHRDHAPVLQRRRRRRSRAGAATPPAAARAARSTTSRPCCRAARGDASCAASSSGVRARRVRDVFGERE